MIDKKDDSFLEHNLKGMMMTLLGAWNAEMDAGRAETEFADIRPSDMRVFGQLRGRAVPLSVIHRELGFSRQAAQQAVDRLVAHGVVRVDMVEGQRRDKVVSVTEKGQGLRSLAARQIRGFEERCADVLGAEAREALRHALIDLVRDAQNRS